MAKPHERVFALVAAVLFLATSVAFSVAVILEMRSSKDDTQQTEAQKAEESATQQPKEGQLQGTKLEGFTPVANVDSLQKVDLVEGTGEVVKEGATVTAHYTGALTSDGTIFQSSKDTGEPATFPLSGVIQGWQQGVPGMKVGGTRRLIIPASLAYGAQERPGIPANSPLVFDIELTAVQQ